MVAKLKADAEQRTSQLRSLVEKMMTKQGTAIANADSMWSFLADGNFTVDEETVSLILQKPFPATIRKKQIF